MQVTLRSDILWESFIASFNDEDKIFHVDFLNKLFF